MHACMHAYIGKYIDIDISIYIAYTYTYTYKKGVTWIFPFFERVAMAVSFNMTWKSQMQSYHYNSSGCGET